MRARHHRIRRQDLGQCAPNRTNQVIPLPEPARRGLVNITGDVIATSNRAVAAAALLDPSDCAPMMTPIGRGGKVPSPKHAWRQAGHTGTTTMNPVHRLSVATDH